MKNKFKYILGSILAVLAVSVIYFLPIKKANARETVGGQTVIVREFLGYYNYSGNIDRIIISYGDNKTETVELENLGPKHFPENTDKINYVLNKLMNSGYTLVSSTGCGGGQAAFMMNTFVLRK